VSGFTPLTLDQLKQTQATAFSSQPGVLPANTDEGSTLGAVFDASALDGLFIQNENAYTEQILRVDNIPALPSGDPNPDLDAFVAQFMPLVSGTNSPRQPATAASGSVTCSTPSQVSSQIIVPANAILAITSGVQFQIQPNGTGYNATLGGYPITPGNSSVVVPVLCLQTGIGGNVPAGTVFTPVGGTSSALPPAVNSITNATAFNNAEPIETDAQLKTRFKKWISTGQTGSNGAVIAAILGVQAGLIYSIGDRVNTNGTGTAPQTTLTNSVTIPAVGQSVTINVANSSAVPSLSNVVVFDGTHAMLAKISSSGTGTLTVTCLAVLASGTVSGTGTVMYVGGSAYFTVVVNIANSGAAAPASLITAVQTAVLAVRSEGIGVMVIGPTTQAVNSIATLVAFANLPANITQSQIVSAAQAAYAAYVNGIGLNPDTTPTTCSIARCYAALLNTQVNGVYVLSDVTGLTLNGGTVDLSASFGTQFVAGSSSFTIS
jgi:hypothetical protein